MPAFCVFRLVGLFMWGPLNRLTCIYIQAQLELLVQCLYYSVMVLDVVNTLWSVLLFAIHACL